MDIEGGTVCSGSQDGLNVRSSSPASSDGSAVHHRPRFVAVLHRRRPPTVFRDPDDQIRLHPIAFESKKLTETEQNYSTQERELLAVKHALNYWRHIVEGSEIHIRTDHASLSVYRQKRPMTRRLGKWRLSIMTPRLATDLVACKRYQMRYHEFLVNAKKMLELARAQASALCRQSHLHSS